MDKEELIEGRLQVFLVDGRIVLQAVSASASFAIPMDSAFARRAAEALRRAADHADARRVSGLN